MNRFFGYAAGALALLGVLTAWADPESSYLIDASALALGCVWLVHACITGEAKTHWLVVLPLLSAMVGLIQLALGSTAIRFDTTREVCTWLARAALFQIAYSGLQEGRTQRQVLNALAGCAAALSVLGTLAWFTAGGKVFWLIPTPYTDEVMATFLNRDHFAIFIELVLPIALFRAFFERKVWGAVAAAAMFGSVVAIGARAGSIILTIEICILAGVSLARGLFTLRRAAAFTLVLSTGVAVYGWQYLWFRFSGSNPLAFRREMLAATIHMVQSRPWIGFGLGTWPSVYPAFAVFDPAGFFMNHAHNDWAELAADGGLPLFAAVLAMFAASLAGMRGTWWAAGIPAALLNACLDFPLHKSSLAGMLFFLLGASSGPRPKTAGCALPILSGPLMGMRWITRSSVLSCWLGSYEKDWLRQLGAVIQPGSVFFDVGAQAGYHTLHASRLVGAGGRVCAFEPVPRNVEYLRRHLALNHIGNVLLLEAAVGDQDGHANFTQGAGFMAGRLTPSGELSVPLLSLDAWLEQGRLPAPDVLKIDVEGSELDVLRGADRLLREHGPAVLVDTHDFLGGECVGIHQRCVAELRRHGYSIRETTAEQRQTVRGKFAGGIVARRNRGKVLA